MDVLMPQLGETVAEGTIAAWFKSVGDTVEEGDALFEVESDKVTMEVDATSAGVLSEIRVGKGDTAPVGAIVAVIASDGAGVGDGAAARQPQTDPLPAATGAPGVGPIVHDHFREVRTPERNFGPAKTKDGIAITPLARRLIKEHGLDAEALSRGVAAAGGRRVRKADVLAAAEAATAAPTLTPRAPAIPVSARDYTVPLNEVRKRTAVRVAGAWVVAPHVFQAVEVDFDRVERARARIKADVKAENGFSLTYLPFIAHAVCMAIRDFPLINAKFDGDRLIVHRDVHLGIAIDLNHEGLVVPVVRHADELSTLGLAKAINRIVEKARCGKLEPGDMGGGTYSISNNGSFGTVFTAPIINTPEVAILSTDAIRKRPVVVESEDGDQIAIRPVGMLVQSFDHRAFDGAYSGAYLSRLKEIIETRDWTWA